MWASLGIILVSGSLTSPEDPDLNPCRTRAMEGPKNKFRSMNDIARRVLTHDGLGLCDVGFGSIFESDRISGGQRVRFGRTCARHSSRLEIYCDLPSPTAPSRLRRPNLTFTNLGRISLQDISCMSDDRGQGAPEISNQASSRH
jgi:hypothetical protein